MARVAAEFRDMMLAMLPRGAAWPREPESSWGRLLHACADEFARIDARNEQLLAEMDTRTVSELLPEWEIDYALPGPCITEPQSFTQRRAALISKFRHVGRQDREFFIEVAAALGYTITITEYNEANPGPHTDYAGLPLTGDAWNYVWQINAQDTSSDAREYGSGYPGPYVGFGIELLECTMRSLAHTHRVLFFAYS